MIDDWASRKTLLSIGKSYRVTGHVLNPTGPDFIIGEQVTLRSVGYIPYDNSHVYEFETESGVLKRAWLNDASPAKSITESFRE